MLFAFMAAALISVVKLFHNRSMKRSLVHAFMYVQGLLQGNICSYRKVREEKNLMHFSVAILIGLVAARAICDF